MQENLALTGSVAGSVKGQQNVENMQVAVRTD